MIETTDFNKSEQYTLSIRLSTDGFSFSVFNPLGDGEFSYYDREVDESFSLTANLKQTFRELAWLERPFRRDNLTGFGNIPVIRTKFFCQCFTFQVTFTDGTALRIGNSAAFQIITACNI